MVVIMIGRVVAMMMMMVVVMIIVAAMISLVTANMAASMLRW